MKLKKILIGCLSAVLVLPVIRDVRAEVTGSTDEEDPYILLLSITENPDPVPGAFWEEIITDNSSDSDPLNLDGGARGDGRPDMAFAGGVESAKIVWAFNAVSDHDIAFSEWTANGWANVEFLTSTGIDELDPRIFVDADDWVYVTWWEDDSQDRVLFTSRDPESDVWATPFVIATNARRPSIARYGGNIVVAFERPLVTGGTELIVATRRPEGSTYVTTVAQTDRVAPLDPILHVRAGRMWLEWKHSSTQFAFSEFVAGSWVAPTGRLWTDKSWVGQEMLRRAIAAELLYP